MTSDAETKPTVENEVDKEEIGQDKELTTEELASVTGGHSPELIPGGGGGSDDDDDDN